MNSKQVLTIFPSQKPPCYTSLLNISTVHKSDFQVLLGTYTLASSPKKRMPIVKPVVNVYD